MVRELWGAYARVLGADREALRAALVAGNQFGENALMWAAANGHRDVAAFLLHEAYPAAMDKASRLAELGRRNHGHGESARAGRRAVDSAAARAATPTSSSPCSTRRPRRSKRKRKKEKEREKKKGRRGRGRGGRIEAGRLKHGGEEKITVGRGEVARLMSTSVQTCCL